MNKRLLLVLVLVFSAAQIFFGCDIGKKDNKNLMMMLAMPQDQSFTPTPPVGGITPTDGWNFLVYMDGDNNLEDAAIYNFCQMERVGSTDKVNILVLFDRIRGYDNTHGNWAGTRLYRVTKNATSDINDTADFTSTLLSEWGPRGEADMSDPKTLQQFIEYCQYWFPAPHTVLTLWNHGAGVYPRVITKNTISQGICFDDTTGRSAWDCLTTDEVASALAGAYATTLLKIDIINLDACLMQLNEVAYQWRNYATYLTGSEETIPWSGNDYYNLLTHLTGNPSMTAQTLANTLVNDFYTFYTTPPNNSEAVTYSAVDLTKVDDFMNDFSNLATALNNDSANHGTIQSAASALNSARFDYPELIDLDAFVTYIKDNASPGSLRTAATAVKTDIEGGSLVINHKATGVYADTKPTHGLAILLPEDSTEWSYYNSTDRYLYLDISVDTQWDEFIKKFITW